MDAIILGGDHTNDELYDTKEKVKGNKFSLFLKNKCMGMYVLDSLLNSDYIDKVVVVTDTTKLKQGLRFKKNVIFVHQVGNLTQNFLEGVRALKLKDNVPILVLASDLPLLKGEAINDLVKEYYKYNSDIFLGLVPYENFKGLLGICVTNFQPIRVNKKLIYAEKVNGLIVKPKHIINNNKVIEIVQLIYENRELESVRRQLRNFKFFPYILKNFGIFGIIQATYLYLVSRFLVLLNKNRNFYWLLPEKENFENRLSKKYKVNIGFVNCPEFSIDCDTEEDKKNIERILR